MATADELRADLAVAELEEQLAKAKASKKGPDRELKQTLRDARQAQRALRQGLVVVTDDRGRRVAVSPEEA